MVLGTKPFEILRNSLSLVRRRWEQPGETSSREGDSDLGVDLESSADCRHIWATGEWYYTDILQRSYTMISYEAGNWGWNKTLAVPSFVVQSPPSPTLYYRLQHPISNVLRDKLPRVATREDNCCSTGSKLGEHITNSLSISRWHLDGGLYWNDHA